MKLDGREFAPITQAITAAQNDYIQAHLALAGVTDLLVEAGMKKTSDEELGPIRRKFITQILLSGQKSAILAGCLIEVGKKWSRADADRNAARFDEISDPDEITEMTNSIAGLVVSFFQFVGTSSGTSLKSSSPNAEVPDTKNADPETSGNSPQ